MSYDRNDSGQYYKTTIIAYAPNWSVIYDRKPFIVQATG